jgi:hypothetical protein
MRMSAQGYELSTHPNAVTLCSHRAGVRPGVARVRRDRVLAVLSGSAGCERRSCGERALARQAFAPLGTVGLVRQELTEERRSGNIRMLAVREPNAAPRGLMASCDIFGERSMQYSTYASANS